MLEGHVIASQKSSAKQSGTTVKTSQLFYDTQRKRIYSPKAVTIIRDHSITHAIGVRLTENQCELQIAHGLYTQ